MSRRGPRHGLSAIWRQPLTLARFKMEVSRPGQQAGMGFGKRDDAGSNERTKHTASWLNTFSRVSVAAGVIAAFATLWCVLIGCICLILEPPFGFLAGRPYSRPNFVIAPLAVLAIGLVVAFNSNWLGRHGL